MNLNIQFYLLIHTILYGMFLGLGFDSVEIMILRMRKGFCRDALIFSYWIIQLPFAVLFFHRVNRGEFQSYLLIFVLFGGFIYFRILRKKYLKSFRRLIKECYQVYKWIKKVLNMLIFMPVVFIFRVISDIMVLPKIIFRKKRPDEDKERLE